MDRSRLHQHQHPSGDHFGLREADGVGAESETPHRGQEAGNCGLLLPQHRQGDARGTLEVHHHRREHLPLAGVGRTRCVEVS